jgi:hypothetical protein
MAQVLVNGVAGANPLGNSYAKVDPSTASRGGEISYSGSDVIAYAYIPLLNDPTETNDVTLGGNKRSALLGTLQTISISSTRSTTPVRTFGRNKPLGYSRGGRTFAGTLVFATLDRDPFSEIYRPDALHESITDSSTSMFVDQLPPFNIIIVASNELGGIARQVVSGVTLINYGVTYSIDDLYTESTYTYVAEDVTPLLPENVSLGSSPTPSYKKMSDVLDEMYKRANGTAEEILGPKTNEYDYADDVEQSLANTTGLRRAFWQREIQNRFRDRIIPPGRYSFLKR